jgi:hypothetical protein
MGLFNQFFSKDDKAISHILILNGGAGKRQDEHRELIALLETKCPDFLNENFWVRGWLESQDEYLNELRILALNKKTIPAHWLDSVRPYLSKIYG